MKNIKYLQKIKHTLKKVHHINPSFEADMLLFLTANYESMRFNYKRQNVNNFNIKIHALSYYQIEYNTFIDLYNTWLKYRPNHLAQVLMFTDKNEYDFELFKEIEHNFELATVIARYIYFRKPQKLPEYDKDFFNNIAKYWKTHYNTHLGKGTEDKFINDALLTLRNEYNII